jgi:hypothetical protein
VSWWTTLLTVVSKFMLWLDARAERERDRTTLAVETREAETKARENERDAAHEAHDQPGRGAVDDRLRKGGF